MTVQYPCLSHTLGLVRYSCQFKRSCDAPAQVIYDLLADVERWPIWLPNVRTACWENLVNHGSNEGAIRRITVGGLTMREKILVAESPHHHAYTILSGIPVADHRADVHIADRPGGSSILWTATFRPRVAFMGPLIWLMLRVSMPTMVRALARGADALGRG